MNLIEQLGWYEKAKRELELKEQNSVLQCCSAVTAEMIRDALLEYRCQHSIFEVGDKVVHPKFSNMKIYEICEISGDLFTVFYDRKSHSFKTDVRHATDEEIKAGKRLGVD